MAIIPNRTEITKKGSWLMLVKLYVKGPSSNSNHYHIVTINNAAHILQCMGKAVTTVTWFIILPVIPLTLGTFLFWVLAILAT